MKPLALFVTLVVAMAAAVDRSEPNYEKGTITRRFPEAKDYELRGAVGGKMFKGCGDFKDGQVVNFRVDDRKLFIRDADGKDYRCSIYASIDPVVKPQVVYSKGTIMGWSTRVDARPSSASDGQSLHLNLGSSQRRTRVFELQGSDYVYAIDDCGAFQAGQFKPGQVVDYRVEDSSKNNKRIYIQHDIDKEYSCRLEAVRVLNPAEASAPAGSQPAN